MSLNRFSDLILPGPTQALESCNTLSSGNMLCARGHTNINKSQSNPETVQIVLPPIHQVATYHLSTIGSGCPWVGAEGLHRGTKVEVGIDGGPGLEELLSALGLKRRWGVID